MILKETMLHVSDNCGINLVKCFHIYQLKKRKYSKIKKFIKVSYRSTTKSLSKLIGKKSKGFFYKSKYFFSKIDGSCFFFSSNNCVLTKKRLYPRGKISKGCILYNIKRIKLLNSFSYTL